MSAVVRVQDSADKPIEARALLDTCATTHLVTIKLAKGLRLPIRPCSTVIGAVDELNTTALGKVNIEMKSFGNNFQKTLSCLVVPKISDFEPSNVFPREMVPIPSNLPLADPLFHLPRPVDLLVGAGVTVSLLQPGQIKLSDKDDLFLQKTKLGWVVVGGIESDKGLRVVSCHLVNLSKQLEKFWAVEEVGADSIASSDEVLCEQHYLKNVERNPDGRYMVRLPFRHVNVDLGDSRTQALRRFLSLQKRFHSNPQFKEQYSTILQNYIDLGHMSLSSDESSSGYYIPHHAIVKASSLTTKVRVVFDASAKTSSGISLNDALMVGPTIQDKLFEHLIRFRTHAYVLTADIEQMYRQVMIHPDDRKFQRIFWYHENQIRVYTLNRVPFGVASAPFLAIRTIHQLANDEAHRFPIASKILKRDIYVDDLLTGANSLNEALQLRDEIIELLKCGQFNIRQWASNHKHALDNVSEKVFGTEAVTVQDVVSKTLGVAWHSQLDSFIYSSKQIDISVKFTKRIVLSEIAKIFDPLGLLGPIILAAKVIMQDCWRLKIGWDDPISQTLSNKWNAFASQLNDMQEMSIGRLLVLPNSQIVEIHGFCDASKCGYGACLYIRSIDQSGTVLVRLVCSKSRVAPIKETTIPRLELCGALTLARLYKEARSALNLPDARCILWSDSTIVLQWLKKSPVVLNVFESNRVREIQGIGDHIEWRHVRTKDNPADALSRGQFPAEFSRNTMWFVGPPWLSLDEEHWPSHAVAPIKELPGLKKKSCFISKPIECEIFNRFSSYKTLVSVMAYCFRLLLSRASSITGKDLSVEERFTSERKILRLIQGEQYSEEIRALERSENVKSSKVAALNPFIDQDGLLRVGGRLKHSDVSEAQKYPILLPSYHHVTDLIIRETHCRVHHAGIQCTLHTIRQRFWLLDGKNQVRKIVRRCVTCVRHRPVAFQYKMADLPSSRVTATSAFEHTGVDYFGPVYIKEKKFRNRVKIKAYGCVFICMATKCVHIEIVSDLTTEGFLHAFTRFHNRRGLPSHVYSDNGLNFVGASNQLHELYQLFNSNQFKERVNSFAVHKKIVWHFNPPESPHFGGIWEAAVKSFKHHFKRVLGTQLLTFEELNTFAIEVEGILNSRPLCSLSSDPNDPSALTPAQILTGKDTTMLPENNLSSVPGNRLTVWKHITQARQDFWRRWSVEYLSELQKRQKWFHNRDEIKEGQVVVLIDKNAPCAAWELGVILEVCPGSDKIKRVVKVKTKRGIFTRNSTALCPLPIE